MPKIQKLQDNYKYSRINQIYEKLLLKPSGVTIGDLAKELDVSTKTIQRDLYEVLSNYGATKEGRHWKIDTKKATDSLGANEKIILGILDEMAKSGGKTFYAKAHSLLAQVSQQLEHPIFANINSESLNETHIESFEMLENAIKNKKEITFSYNKWDFQAKPLKLVFFDGFWYLLVFDSNDNHKFKKFHLKSIENIVITEQDFKISEIVEDRLRNANSIWFNLDEPFSVKLLLDKEIVKYFERKPLKNQVVMGQDKDGSVEIEIKITDAMEIIPIIMWYIPYIRVLEPEWLGEKIKKSVDVYIKKIS